MSDGVPRRAAGRARLTSAACSATTRRSSSRSSSSGSSSRRTSSTARRTGTAFLTPKQVSTTFLYAAVLGLIAAGQTLVMLTGGVDLSVATTATAAAFMVSRFGEPRRRDRDRARARASASSSALVNGIGVAIFRVNALIMTLGISMITLGLLTVLGAEAVHRARPALRRHARLGAVPAPTSRTTCCVWAPISALIILGLRYSGIGRMIYAVGDNPVASRLAGVRVWQVQLFVYAACGVLSALAGVLLVGFNNAADLGIATPFLLPSVAAVVIGGTSIFGGVRRLRGHDPRRADPDRARLAADDPQRVPGGAPDPLRR